MTKKKIKPKTEPKPEPEPKKLEPKVYDWSPKKSEGQWYENDFFKPYIEELEPKIPEDYKDPIYDEERAMLHASTPEHPEPTDFNMNIGNLLKFYYEDLVRRDEYKDLHVAVLIPTFDGTLTVQCGFSLVNMAGPTRSYRYIIGHNIDVQRNALVNMALEDPTVTHIFFVDGDVQMPPYTLMRLLRRSVEQKKDIVAGVYTMKSPPYVPLVIMRPRNSKGECMYNYYLTLTKERLNKVIPIDATGGGCLLIKREVLEKMGPPWFKVTHQQHGITAIGEDLFFFDKAKKLGINVWMDTSVQCEHGIGYVTYPKVFLEGKAGVGGRSLAEVDSWNKNAILFANDLPLFNAGKDPKLKQQQKVNEK